MEKQQKLKSLWQTPRLIILDTNQITSGNPADPRKGEYVAYTPGTGCGGTTINASCLTSGEFQTYNTGEIASQAICYNDARTMTYYIPICS